MMYVMIFKGTVSTQYMQIMNKNYEQNTQYILKYCNQLDSIEKSGKVIQSSSATVTGRFHKASLSMICLNLEMSRKENQQVDLPAKQNETAGSCDLKSRRGGCVPVLAFSV